MLGNIETLIRELMAEWQVPALALAVLRRDGAELLEAYGERDVEAGLPATVDTQFAICSITKSMTAAGLAMLAEERKLDWARPACDYLPELRLKDPVATGHLSLRDMLVHRSGLPRHDWVHMAGHLDDAGMLAALRHLEPSRDFRQAHQYNNLLYLAAGLVAARVAGMSWEDFTRTRLFAPLEMRGCTFSVLDMEKTVADFAQPYALFEVDGAPYERERRRVPMRPIRTRPAGGVTASIAAMANYLRFLLDEGSFAGRQLLAPDSIRLMAAPEIYCGRSEFAEIGEVHYGLGLGTCRYRGERMVSHGGGWLGWRSLLAMLPERGIGVVVLTNRDSNPLPEILTYAVFDRLCGLEEAPWRARFLEQRDKWRRQRVPNLAAHAAARKKDAPPSHPFANYAGAYEHPAYGRVVVSTEGEGLRWRGLSLDLPLAHRHYDVFELPEDIASYCFMTRSVTFSYDREGEIDRLAVPFEPMVADIVFRRVYDMHAVDPAFLAACAGTYRSGPTTHVVGLDAKGQLTLSPTGQPTYHLVPYRSTTFALRELEGYRVEFRKDAAGEIDAIVFHQPDGTFIAERAG